MCFIVNWRYSSTSRIEPVLWDSNRKQFVIIYWQMQWLYIILSVVYLLGGIFTGYGWTIINTFFNKLACEIFCGYCIHEPISFFTFTLAQINWKLFKQPFKITFQYFFIVHQWLELCGFYFSCIFIHAVLVCKEISTFCIVITALYVLSDKWNIIYDVKMYKHIWFD